MWVLGYTKVVLTTLFWQGMFTPKACAESVYPQSRGPSHRRLTKVDEGFRSGYSDHMTRHKGDVIHGAGVDTPEPPAGAGAKSGQTPSGESNEDISQITPVGRRFLPRTCHACTVHPGSSLLESHPH
jgi:hypothetical protein